MFPDDSCCFGYRIVVLYLSALSLKKKYSPPIRHKMGEMTAYIKHIV